MRVSEDFVQEYDVGVLTLDRAVRISDYIRPVCLPAAPGELDQRSLWFVTGWGTTSYRRVLSDTLQQVQVRNHMFVTGLGTASYWLVLSDTLKQIQVRNHAFVTGLGQKIISWFCQTLWSRFR